MVVIRDIFQLRFGKTREAVQLMKQGLDVLRQLGYPAGRLLTDVTGEYYTLVMESSFASFAEFETSLQEASKSKAWQEIYQKFIPLVKSGRREVFREVS